MCHHFSLSLIASFFSLSWLVGVAWKWQGLVIRTGGFYLQPHRTTQVVIMCDSLSLTCRWGLGCSWQFWVTWGFLCSPKITGLMETCALRAEKMSVMCHAYTLPCDMAHGVPLRMSKAIKGVKFCPLVPEATVVDNHHWTLSWSVRSFVSLPTELSY